MPVYAYSCSKCWKDYDQYLTLEKYEEKTFCPDCNGEGNRVIAPRQKEPTFSDKIFPYYDTSLNKIFSDRTEKQKWMDKHGYVNTGGDRMTKKQERMVYGMRHWGKNARNARRD